MTESIKIAYRITVIILVLILVNPLKVRGNGLMEQDGTNWQSFSEEGKILWVNGFLSNTLVERKLRAFLSVMDDIIKLEKDTLGKRNGEFYGSLFKKLEEELERFTFYNITVGTIKDGLDTFYKDFSNRRTKIVDGVCVVKMQIDGVRADLIEAQVRYLKMQPTIDEISWRRLGQKKLRGEKLTKEEELILYGKYVDREGKEWFLFKFGSYR